jgi:hypothetical protein
MWSVCVVYLCARACVCLTHSMHARVLHTACTRVCYTKHTCVCARVSYTKHMCVYVLHTARVHVCSKCALAEVFMPSLLPFFLLLNEMMGSFPVCLREKLHGFFNLYLVYY